MNNDATDRFFRLGAAALLWLAVGLDCVGVALHAEAVWRLGGLLAWAALFAAVLAIPLSTRTHAGCLRVVIAGIGIAFFALGRWLRGSAGVPPDAPLLAAAIIGAALFTVAWLFPRAPRRSPGSEI